jgi:hypothetical protein
MDTLIEWTVTCEKSERLGTKREEELGMTKNEVEGYGKGGKLDGCNRLQSLT